MTRRRLSILARAALVMAVADSVAHAEKPARAGKAACYERPFSPSDAERMRKAEEKRARKAAKLAKEQA